MSTITCMRGYPASGKSTIALQIAKDTGAIRVCRDDLRMMLLGSYWTGIKADEEKVTDVETDIVDSVLDRGGDLVIDATHLNPAYLEIWKKAAALYDATLTVHDVRTNVETCLYRDARRDRKVGVDVIRRMAEQFPMESWPDFG